FFLVFRALGAEKGSPFLDAFFASSVDYAAAKQFNIFDESDQPVAWEALSQHVRRMLAVLAWLGKRYVWYQVFAAQHDLRYMPHPLRDFFAFDFLRRLEQGSHSANQFAEAFHSGMKTFEGKLQTALKDLSLSRSEPELQIPVFLPLLAKKAKSGEEFWENLLKLRHDQSVMELRSVLVEADNAADRGDIAGFVKMSKEMRTVGEAVLRERGLEPRWISFSPPLSLFGVSVKGDDAGVRLPILPSLYKQFFLNRRYRAFVRNVMEEIAAVATFGNLKDRLDGYARAKPSQFGSFYVNRKEVVPSKYYQPLKDAAPPWS
ncbi:MAG: hypothetical protein JWN40_611, partial [Phycisphaerales bacterium]|nr:hypothetical protein [Phycisphaerales bacterium]